MCLILILYFCHINDYCRIMANAFLLLGSDLGDKAKHLRNAIMQIEKHAGKITRRSHIYETEPWGFEHEEYFLNQVICIETNQKPVELLATIQQIENEMGRLRGDQRYMPRTIDIDILFYDHRIIVLPELVIPHPEMSKRRFVLEPLAELYPEWIHPLLKKDINQLLQECTDPGKVTRTELI